MAESINLDILLNAINSDDINSVVTELRAVMGRLSAIDAKLKLRTNKNIKRTLDKLEVMINDFSLNTQKGDKKYRGLGSFYVLIDELEALAKKKESLSNDPNLEKTYNTVVGKLNSALDRLQNIEEEHGGKAGVKKEAFKVKKLITIDPRKKPPAWYKAYQEAERDIKNLTKESEELHEAIKAKNTYIRHFQEYKHLLKGRLSDIVRIVDTVEKEYSEKTGSTYTDRLQSSDTSKQLKKLLIPKKFVNVNDLKSTQEAQRALREAQELRKNSATVNRLLSLAKSNYGVSDLNIPSESLSGLINMAQNLGDSGMYRTSAGKTTKGKLLYKSVENLLLSQITPSNYLKGTENILKDDINISKGEFTKDLSPKTLLYLMNKYNLVTKDLIEKYKGNKTALLTKVVEDINSNVATSLEDPQMQSRLFQYFNNLIAKGTGVEPYMFAERTKQVMPKLMEKLRNNVSSTMINAVLEGDVDRFIKNIDRTNFSKDADKIISYSRGYVTDPINKQNMLEYQMAQKSIKDTVTNNILKYGSGVSTKFAESVKQNEAVAKYDSLFDEIAQKEHDAIRSQFLSKQSGVMTIPDDIKTIIDNSNKSFILAGLKERLKKSQAKGYIDSPLSVLKKVEDSMVAYRVNRQADIQKIADEFMASPEAITANVLRNIQNLNGGISTPTPISTHTQITNTGLNRKRMDNLLTFLKARPESYIPWGRPADNLVSRINLSKVFDMISDTDTLMDDVEKLMKGSNTLSPADSAALYTNIKKRIDAIEAIVNNLQNKPQTPPTKPYSPSNTPSTSTPTPTPNNAFNPYWVAQNFLGSKDSITANVLRNIQNYGSSVKTGFGNMDVLMYFDKIKKSGLEGGMSYGEDRFKDMAYKVIDGEYELTKSMKAATASLEKQIETTYTKTTANEMLAKSLQEVTRQEQALRGEIESGDKANKRYAKSAQMFNQDRAFMYDARKGQYRNWGDVYAAVALSNKGDIRNWSYDEKTGKSSFKAGSVLDIKPEQFTENLLRNLSATRDVYSAYVEKLGVNLSGSEQIRMGRVSKFADQVFSIMFDEKGVQRSADEMEKFWMSGKGRQLSYQISSGMTKLDETMARHFGEYFASAQAEVQRLKQGAFGINEMRGRMYKDVETVGRVVAYTDFRNNNEAVYYGGSEEAWLDAKYGRRTTSPTGGQEVYAKSEPYKNLSAIKSYEAALNNTWARVRQITEDAPNLLQSFNLSFTKMAFAFSRVAYGFRVIGMELSIFKAIFTATFNTIMNKVTGYTNYVVEQTEVQKRAYITLSGIFDKTVAEKMISFGRKYAVESPATFKEIIEMLQSFGLNPATKRMIDDTASSTKGLNKTLKELAYITVGLAATKPEQGIKGSMFAIREMMVGNFISLKRRFEIPPEALAMSVGKTVADLKKSPEILKDALTAYLNMNIGEDTLKRLSHTATVQLANIKDFMEQATAVIGESGFYDTLTAMAESIGNTFRSLLDIKAFKDYLTKLSDELSNFWITTYSTVVKTVMSVFSPITEINSEVFATMTREQKNTYKELYKANKDYTTELYNNAKELSKQKDSFLYGATENELALYVEQGLAIKQIFDLITLALKTLSPIVKGVGTYFQELFKTWTSDVNAVEGFTKMMIELAKALATVMNAFLTTYATIFKFIGGLEIGGSSLKTVLTVFALFPVASMNIGINAFRMLFETILSLTHPDVRKNLSIMTTHISNLAKEMAVLGRNAVSFRGLMTTLGIVNTANIITPATTSAAVNALNQRMGTAGAAAGATFATGFFATLKTWFSTKLSISTFGLTSAFTTLFMTVAYALRFAVVQTFIVYIVNELISVLSNPDTWSYVTKVMSVIWENVFTTEFFTGAGVFGMLFPMAAVTGIITSIGLIFDAIMFGLTMAYRHPMSLLLAALLVKGPEWAEWVGKTAGNPDKAEKELSDYTSRLTDSIKNLKDMQEKIKNPPVAEVRQDKLTGESYMVKFDATYYKDMENSIKQSIVNMLNEPTAAAQFAVTALQKEGILRKSSEIPEQSVLKDYGIAGYRMEKGRFIRPEDILDIDKLLTTDLTNMNRGTEKILNTITANSEAIEKERTSFFGRLENIKEAISGISNEGDNLRKTLKDISDRLNIDVSGNIMTEGDKKTIQKYMGIYKDYGLEDISKKVESLKSKDKDEQKAELQKMIDKSKKAEQALRELAEKNVKTTDTLQSMLSKYIPKPLEGMFDSALNAVRRFWNVISKIIEYLRSIPVINIGVNFLLGGVGGWYEKFSNMLGGGSSDIIDAEIKKQQEAQKILAKGMADLGKGGADKASQQKENYLKMMKDFDKEILESQNRSAEARLMALQHETDARIEQIEREYKGTKYYAELMTKAREVELAKQAKLQRELLKEMYDDVVNNEFASLELRMQAYDFNKKYELEGKLNNLETLRNRKMITEEQYQQYANLTKYNDEMERTKKYYDMLKQQPTLADLLGSKDSLKILESFNANLLKYIDTGEKALTLRKDFNATTWQVVETIKESSPTEKTTTKISQLQGKMPTTQQEGTGRSVTEMLGDLQEAVYKNSLYVLKAQIEEEKKLSELQLKRYSDTERIHGLTKDEIRMYRDRISDLKLYAQAEEEYYKKKEMWIKNTGSLQQQFDFAWKEQVRKLPSDYEIVKSSTESMFNTMRDGFSNVLVAGFQGDTQKMKDSWNEFVQTLKNTFLKMLADLIVNDLFKQFFGGFLNQDRKNIKKDVESVNLADKLMGGLEGGLGGALTGANAGQEQGAIQAKTDAILAPLEQGAGVFSSILSETASMEKMTSMDATYALTELAFAAQEAALALYEIGGSGEGGDWFSGLGGMVNDSFNLENEFLDLFSFADGGVVSKPTLAVVGDGNTGGEAMVPLKNGAIPVQMSGKQDGQIIEVQVVNLINDDAINAAIERKPNTVINVIDSNIAQNGSTARIIANKRR